jgi:tetratricopeptide (TPR) repeat protein
MKVLCWTLLLLLSQTGLREQMQEAFSLLQTGETEKARDLLESIAAEHPQFGPARFQLGQMAAARGDWQEAKRQLEAATEANLLRPDLAWSLLGRTYRALGDVRAREAFEHAIDIAPDRIPPRRALAEIAEAEGDLWTALSQLRRIVAIDPERKDAFAALANTARRMGALDLARCAVQRAGNDGSVAYLRAVIEEGDGAVDDAIAWAKRALELGFENAAVYLTLGNLYHEKMQLPEAIDAFERAVTLDPAASESLASFALTSLTTEDYARLRSLLERHVEAHPDSVNTLYGLGAMYLREGELDQAEGVFEHLKALLPDASQVHYNLSMVYRRQGRTEEAGYSLARFKELKHDEDREWERQNELHRMRLRMKEAVSPEDVVPLGEALLSSGSPELEDFLQLAEALSKLGRTKEATHYIDLALEQDPYHRGALESRRALALELDDGEAATLYEGRLALLSPDCAP